MTLEEKLNSINGYNVWAFTKQKTSFEDAFRAAKLLNEMPRTSNCNVATYFKNNYRRYGLLKNNYRALIIAQMYGLITKTPYFKSRGCQYKNEKTTEVFKKLDSYGIGTDEFNTIKTEQIIKMRAKSIIDSSNHRDGFEVLPLVFSFLVLWKLKNEKNIDGVSIGAFYTYAMTCKTFEEIDETVAFLSNPNVQPSIYLSEMKSNSRVLASFKKNTNLFKITYGNNGKIKLNEKAAQYFYNCFISRIDLDDLIDTTTNIGNYVYYLTHIQEYGINLLRDSFDAVDSPSGNQSTKRQVSKMVRSKEDDLEFDGDYVGTVDEVDEKTINPKMADGASKIPVKIVGSSSSSKRIYKNQLYGKIVLMETEYKCEHDHSHVTFISSKSGKPFMEAHHLLPAGKAVEIWNKYKVNIDCVENLVSLCPNCHSAIHYGNKEKRRELVKDLYNKKKKGYEKIGLPITLKELLAIYKCQ